MNRWLPICLLIGCLSCTRPPRTITRGFYYWKQRYAPDTTVLHTLEALHTHRLYVKLFDVALAGDKHTAIPIARLDQRSAFPAGMEIIPTVFIMNDVWPQVQPDTLAAQVARLLSQMSPQQAPEVQIDCDWTRNSRQPYFAFLQAFRQQPFLHGRQLSVTIRLHQLKFLASSGVPPADKGLLMCYNMGNLRQYGEHNSILNMEDMKAYTGNNRIKQYPLSLDLALPLFSWSVLFRQHNYAGLLRNLDENSFHSRQVFRHKSGQLYTVIKDTVMNGYALHMGDEVRYENCTPALLEETAHYLSARCQDRDPVVIFYHLDENILSKYALSELEKTYNILR
ncbi:hypothetical protein F0L74_10665 [Chitinophaga agrisoli]|uniref:Uncharacterized protein n=1 Tax=Chitinophaga agrisoli TaxID=2607653 RepID=A0A5B2VV87_9BACT|nr:hypothetical protein [Chitinophaga agrisoli]KAA2242975.1 hypothetical protein F0L74_10665 [Chitinophaga agrisoli]